jgi:DNA-binding MurR/RpiR family transcriptional regulator
LIAAEAAIKLRKLGIAANFQPDSHLQAMGAALLQEGDVLLAISHSGRSVETLHCAQLAKTGKAHVIAVTGFGPSPLHRLADVVLPTVSHDTNVEPTASSVAALAVIHALFLLLFASNGDRLQNTYALTQAAVDQRQRRGSAR